MLRSLVGAALLGLAQASPAGRAAPPNAADPAAQLACASSSDPRCLAPTPGSSVPVPGYMTIATAGPAALPSSVPQRRSRHSGLGGDDDGFDFKAPTSPYPSRRLSRRAGLDADGSIDVDGDSGFGGGDDDDDSGLDNDGNDHSLSRRSSPEGGDDADDSAADSAADDSDDSDDSVAVAVPTAASPSVPNGLGVPPAVQTKYVSRVQLYTPSATPTLAALPTQQPVGNAVEAREVYTEYITRVYIDPPSTPTTLQTRAGSA